MEYLATRNYDCYALDLRGSGNSYKSDFEWYASITLNDYVEDIEAVVDDIQGRDYEKIFLIGHSMGGMVSVMYAAEHSDDLAGLIIIGTMFQEFGLPNEQLAQFRYAAENYPVIPCDPSYVEPMFFANVEDEILETTTDIVTQEVFGATTALQVLDLIFAEKVDDIDEDIPVLLLKGELDALAPNDDAEDFLDALDGEDKELIIFENHGHDILLEKKPKKVYKEIFQWLKAHN
jgi:alpha-beta hydrolase superfamily lysophospholipase